VTPDSAVSRAPRPFAGRGALLVAGALPVAVAVVVAGLLDRPWLAGLAAGAAAVAAGVATLARRHGALACWIVLLALAIVAGEVSAISLGGQSGRLLWADLVLGLGVLVVLVRRDGRFDVPRTPLATSLVPWIAWSAFTLLFARDALTGIAELKEWVVAWMVLAAVLAFARDRARARLLLVVVAWVTALIGLLMVESAARSPMGWVLAVLLKKVDLPWGRTNYLAGLLIVGIPLTLGLLGHASTLRGRLHALFLVLCQLVGLVLSASKGGILALVIGLLAAYLPAARAARWGLATLGIVLASGVFVFVAGPLRQVLDYRLQSSAVEYSVGERVDLYELGWQSFVRSPVWGLGLNNFSVASNRLTGVDTVPHNLELGLLAEVGLPGLVLALVWIAAFGRAAWKARDPRHPARDRALGLGLWAAFVAFLFHNQIESTIYGEQYKILLMITAAAAWGLSCGAHEPRSASIANCTVAER
jgi:O-antigen ligase